MIWSKYNLFFKAGYRDPAGRNLGILYNTLSGAVEIITVEKYRELQSFVFRDDGEREECFRKKQIFHGASEENDTTRLFYAKYQEYLRTAIPSSYVIVVTSNCNLKCVYCCAENIVNQGGNTLITREQIDSIFSVIKSDQTKKYIQLYGGEPLLKGNTGIIEYILKCARNSDNKVTIATNGTHLNYYLELLGVYKDTLSNIQVTLDGPKHIHDLRRVSINGKDTYSKILDNLKRMVNLTGGVTIRVNVDKNNLDHLPELMSELEKEDLFHEKVTVYLAPVSEVGCTSDYQDALPQDVILEKVLEHQSRNRIMKRAKILGWRGYDTFYSLFEEGKVVVPQFQFCEANMKTRVFNLDNKVYPCVSTMHLRDEAIGVLSDSGVRYDPKVLAKWREHSAFREDCRECRFALLCGGGCLALTDTGLKEHCESIGRMMNICAEHFFPKAAERFGVVYG
jgi:uncharacterized protein